MRTVKLTNFQINNYEKNGMPLKSFDHELSEFKMVG